MSTWPSTKARRVLAAVTRLGWQLKRQSGSHRTLARHDWPDVVFAFHDEDELGPQMLARIAKVSGLSTRGPIVRLSSAQRFAVQLRGPAEAAAVQAQVHSAAAEAIRAPGSCKRWLCRDGVEKTRIPDLGSILHKLNIDPGDDVAEWPILKRPACSPG